MSRTRRAFGGGVSGVCGGSLSRDVVTGATIPLDHSGRSGPGARAGVGNLLDVSTLRRGMVEVAASKRDGPPLREKPQQIADELRSLIVSGQLTEGESIGREPELVERFGVSRPSLREALRILEAEGLITVVRGVYGGVVVHEPNQRMTARTATLVLRGAQRVARRRVRSARAARAARGQGDRGQARPPDRGRRAAPPDRRGRGVDRGPGGVRCRERRRSTSGSCRSAATRPSPSSRRCSTRSWCAPSPR